MLVPFRNQHDYVGGGVALNYNWPRLSDDLDIFHDRRNQLPKRIEKELQALRDADFSVEVSTSDPYTVEAIVRRYGFETRVQWFDDPETCRRYFPASFDAELGFRLHEADLAVNKTLAASSRYEVRDAVDMANIVRRYAPLGPLVWAAVGKAHNVNPLQMLRHIRERASGFSDEQIRTVRMEDDQIMTREELRELLLPAIEGAVTYCEETAPEDHVGCLIVDADERPIAADAAALRNGIARALPLIDFTPAIAT